MNNQRSLSVFIFIFALSGIGEWKENQRETDDLSVFSNSQIDWELLPTSEVFPHIPIKLLDQFDKLSSQQLSNLENSESSFAFFYVATAIKNQDIGKLPSFNILNSSTRVKSAFGALTVNLQFQKIKGKLSKEVSYSKPFGNSSPLLKGIFVFPYSNIDATSEASIQESIKTNEFSTPIDDKVLDAIRLAKPIVSSTNVTNYSIYMPVKVREQLYSYSIPAFRDGSVLDSHLVNAHIALSGRFYGRHKQVSFHEDGVTVVLNGLTLLAEYDFELGEWNVSCPELELEKPSLLRSWQMKIEAADERVKKTQEKNVPRLENREGWASPTEAE